MSVQGNEFRSGRLYPVVVHGIEHKVFIWKDTKGQYMAQIQGTAHAAIWAGTSRAALDHAHRYLRNQA